MTLLSLADAFLINPPVRISKGTSTPFVAMDDVEPFRRDVRSSYVRPYSGGAKFIPGDIVMARITPSLENGKTSRYVSDGREPAAGSTEFIVIRGRDGVSDTSFAYYLFTSTEVREFAISQMNGSSGRQRVQTDSLATYKISLPPLAEQRGIAATLGALDDKIESNRRLLSLIWEVATTSIEKACELASISVTVDKVATFHNRRRVPLSSRERDKRPGPYPYYGATGIFGYVDDFLFDEVLVLVGEDGSVVRDGGTPVLQYIWGKSWINNHAHPLTGKGISNELLLLALARADVRQLVTGAVQPKISMGNLKSYALELPTGDVLHDLESKLTSLFDVYRQRSDENLKLTKLRDALLPELLSGRIRVPEAKETVEEAV